MQKVFSDSGREKMNDYAEVEVDQMAEDIFEQQEKKKPRNLNDIQPYLEDEYIGADDFDIGYRTPPKLYLNEESTARDLIKSNVLPEKYIMVPDPDKYFDELYETYPEKVKGFKLPPGEYNKKKYRPKETNTNKKEPVLLGLYSLNFDEIAVKEPDISDPNSKWEMLETLIHEDTHQKQRRMEYNNPKSRVLSEPSVPLFEKMFKENTIMKEFNEKVAQSNVPFEEQQELRKNRKIVTKKFKKQIFPEQLAYYGDHFIWDTITDPRNKTERALNRLKFKDAPIWGMKV